MGNETIEKTATDPKDLIGETHGEDIVDLMDRIYNLEDKDKFNSFVLLNKPFSRDTLAGMGFADIHMVDVKEGTPKFFKTEFNKQSDENKLKDIDGLLNSIVGMIASLEKVQKGLMNFAKSLLDMKESLECRK